MEPIKDDKELVQCLQALIASEQEVKESFLVLPEDNRCKHNLTLRQLVLDYLRKDRRLSPL